MASPFNPFDPVAPASVGGPGASGQGPLVPAARLSVAGPPVGLLAVAGGVAAVGIVVAALGWGTWIALIGWGLAGPAAIGVLAAFLAVDTDRRTQAVYVRPDWLTAAYVVVALLAGAGIVVGALGAGFWAGRL